MKKFFSNDFYVGILLCVISFMAIGWLGFIVPFTSGYGYYRSKKAFKSGNRLALICVILNGAFFVLYVILGLGVLFLTEKLKK